MKARHGYRNRVIAVTAWVLTALWVATIAFLLYPWPQVTVVGEPSIVGSSTVPAGGVVTWQRQEVCVPAGMTRVNRYAEQLDEADPRLQIEFDVPGFTIDADERVCFNPSITPILLPNYIGPGTWRIRVETITDHPGPGDTRGSSFGPEFRITN